MVIKPIAKWTAAAALCAATLPAYAQTFTVVNNLSNPTSNAELIEDPSSGAGHADLAQSFTTGGSAAQLQDVTINLYRVSGGGGVQVSIFSDASGSPGSSLLTLTGPSDPLPGQDRTYGNATYSGTLTLAANTKYWVEARDIAGVNTSYAWNYTSSSTTAGGSAGTIGSGAMNVSGGSGWQTHSGGPFLFSVTATPVPEPSTYAIISGLSLAAFAAYRKIGPRS